jgi:hypothetical protein
MKTKIFKNIEDDRKNGNRKLGNGDNFTPQYEGAKKAYNFSLGHCSTGQDTDR